MFGPESPTTHLEMQPSGAGSARRDEIREPTASATRRPLSEHAKLAHAALVDTLERHGFTPKGTAARAERNEAGGVSITLSTAETVPGPVRQAAAMRVLSVVNRVDKDAPTVSISFVPADDVVGPPGS
jgi:hypothetical protein